MELGLEIQLLIDQLQKIETFIPVEGDYQIMGLAETGKSTSRYFKIVTNDKQQHHVDAPTLYSSLEEAMARVEELEKQKEHPG